MKNRLEEIRKSNGITQEELASILEVSRQTIGSLENGRYNPSIILAFKISKYFRVSIEDIFIYEEGEEDEKNKNVVKACFLTFLGIGLVVVGFLFHKNSVSTDKMMATISYIFIGVGCGIFGHFMDNLIKYFSTKNHEELERQIQIEKNDERNILIVEKSKAKAYDLMIYLFASLLIIFL